MKWVFCAAACILGAALPAAPAAADPFWLYQGTAEEPLTRGQFYTGASVFGGFQKLPGVKSPFSLMNAPGVMWGTTFDRPLGGAQPSGKIGYMFADGSLPAWLGQRLRLEVSGDAMFYSARTSRTTIVPPNTMLGYTGVGGASVIGTSTSDARSLVEDFRVRREGFGLAMTLASDHAMGPNLMLSPSIAVFGGHTRDSYRLKAEVFYFGTAPAQANEWMNTTEVGFRMGLAAQWQFAPGWTMNLGGHAGMVYLHSKLKGEDCIVSSGSGVETDCGPSLASPMQTFLNTRDSAFGFRGGASASISANMRFAVVTVGGSFRYDSHIPGIANPRFDFVSVSSLAPARIKYSGGFAYGGFVRIAVPLNGLGL